MYEIKYRDTKDMKSIDEIWLLSIPNEWQYLSLGYITKMIVPMRDKPTSFNGDIPWIRIEDFKGKYISNSESGQNVSNSLIKKMNLKVYPIGTVLCTCSCSLGTTAITTQKMTSNQTFIGIVPSSMILADYLYYLLAEKAEKLQFMANGAIQKYLSRENFERLKIQLPKFREQEKIANFLDIKTTQFDIIIAKKEQLIKKLEEAKKSLISEVVTGKVKIEDGHLVPRDVSEMKESGVEWLGMVPKEWKISKIKYDTYVKGRIGWQGLKSDEFIDVGPHLVTGSDFKGNRVDWNECYRINEKRYLEAPAIQLSDGDLLITKDGTIGKLAIVEDCPDKAILNSGIFVTRCKNNMYLTKFMFYMLSSETFDVYVDLNSTGSTIKHLYQNTFVNFVYIVPDIETQKKIIESLDLRVSNINKLIDATSLHIEKLKQAKHSLISEAVTGKIDLRDWKIIEEGELL